MRRTVLSITLAIALSVFGSWFILGGGTTKTDTVSANSFDNLSGWAWSGYTDADGNLVGVGWISFNSTDCDTDKNNYIDTNAMVNGCGGDNVATPAINYGVNISPLTGTGYFSGHAWSSNIGRVSFDAGETASCGGGAQIDWATGVVTGWAKATAANGSGNWDGCIKLSDSAGFSYGVTLSGRNFSGYAWGGNEVVGWINWNPAGGGVKMPPQCSDGIDNDGNGWTDSSGNDPGCTNASDTTESNTLPQCSDQVDNDGDGFCDAAGSICLSGITNPEPITDCTSLSDTSESSPQCSDGIDNDGDGTYDYSSVNLVNPDSGCTSATDNTERDFKFKEF